MTATDTHLDKVTLEMLTWKPTVSRNVAVAIVEAVVRAGCLFTDEVKLGFVPGGDVNVIGCVWRRLATAQVIAPTGRFRQSAKPDSKGRKVFEYRLASLQRARVFLARNGRIMLGDEQRELFAT